VFASIEPAKIIAFAEIDLFSVLAGQLPLLAVESRSRAEKRFLNYVLSQESGVVNGE